MQSENSPHDAPLVFAERRPAADVGANGINEHPPLWPVQCASRCVEFRPDVIGQPHRKAFVVADFFAGPDAGRPAAHQAARLTCVHQSIVAENDINDMNIY